MASLLRLLPRVLLESFFIILSVLAALAVSQWGAKRERVARADEARAAFTSEIKANRERLASDAVLGHHRELQVIYSEAARAGAADPGALFTSGLHAADARDAAWRSFSSATIFADFAADDVLLLSDIYREQAAIERRSGEFLGGLMVPRSDRETPAYQRDVAGAVAMFLNDLVPAEERLLKDYDRALDQLARKP